MENITLSHKDSCRFDEMAQDRKAAEATLQVALAFHQNTMNTIGKSNKELWDHVVETHKLDDGKEYQSTWSSLERRFIVTQKEDD